MPNSRNSGHLTRTQAAETHRDHAITATPLRYELGGWHGSCSVQPLEGSGPRLHLKVRGPFASEAAAQHAAVAKAKDVIDRLLG